MPPPAPALMVPIASRDAVGVGDCSRSNAPRSRLVPLDLSSGKHVAHRLRVPLPAAGRGDPACIQGVGIWFSDVAPARRISRITGSTLAA